MDTLRQKGLDAAASPLMTTRFLSAPMPDLPANSILVFTSANGVRAWSALFNIKRPAFTVGEATATTAREAGLEVEACGGGDVDALFDTLCQLSAGRPVCHIRGRHSTGQLTQRLRSEGIKADAVELYEAEAARALPANLREAITVGGHGVGVFSPRSMRLFLDLVRSEGLGAQVGKMRAICLSPAVAQQARDISFLSVHVAKHPTLAAFVDTAQLRRT